MMTAGFFLQMLESHQSRVNSIKACIEYQASEVERLREAKMKAHQDNNMAETNALSNGQRKVRVPGIKISTAGSIYFRVDFT